MPMPREDAHTKAARYVTEGRLVVSRVDKRIVEATCRGDGRVYRLGRTARGWHCDCAAMGRCSHLVALGLVVAIDSS